MSQFQPPSQAGWCQPEPDQSNQPPRPFMQQLQSPPQPLYTQPEKYQQPVQATQHVSRPPLPPTPRQPQQRPPVHGSGPDRLEVWVFVTIVLLLVFGIAGYYGTHNNLSSSQQTSTTTDQTTPVDQSTILQGTWTTTHTFTGNGTQKTEIFTVPDDWKILYTCVSQGNVEGALGVEVYGPDNTIIDVAINATCKVGVAKTTGETEEHQAGNIYLSMDGTGDWTVQVQELK